MKLKLTLDRYEGDFGVCFDENDMKYDIPRSVIPSINEGDIFLISLCGAEFSDPEPQIEETEERRRKIRARLNKIFERSKKEDIN